MIGELACALPEEGGYYIWVRRALGPFWGFQEAWLSLAASIFDMAIYPAIFVLYLGRIEPLWTAGYRGTLWALAVVSSAPLEPARRGVVGEGSIGMFVLLLAPFVVLVSASSGTDSPSHPALAMEPRTASGRLLDGDPRRHVELHGLGQRLHRRPGGRESPAQLSSRHDRRRRARRRHLHPAARRHGLAGIPAGSSSTGDWTTAARTIVGPRLALAVVLGGLLTGIGMFNALILSYTRVPTRHGRRWHAAAGVAKRTNRAECPG